MIYDLDILFLEIPWWGSKVTVLHIYLDQFAKIVKKVYTKGVTILL